MTEKTYKTITFITRKVLPALVTLVIGLGETWNIPYYEAIAGSIGLVDAFMNTWLDELSAEYFAQKEENNE